MPNLDLPVTDATVNEHLRYVAGLFGWRVCNVHVADDGVAYQFRWTPADDVLPEGDIACFPVVKSEDGPLSWVDFSTAVQASVGAMHMQYAARRDVTRSQL
jgi:hypothetical protein